MSPNEEEEPVAYLGGKSGDAGAPGDDQPVEGYLGGAAAEPQPEELPALPPAGVSAVYSASDFIAPPPEVEEPPSYDNYAADPVAEPAPEQSDMDQYAAHPAEEPAPGTATVVEPASQEASSDFDEPGLPKTISQQDAENIIKRITTKKILPPDVAANEGPRVNPPAELTPRGSPKLGRVVVILLLVIGGYGAAVYFNDQLAPYLPAELYPFIWYTPPPPKPVDDKPPEKTPAQIKEEALRKIVLESEWRAFGYASKEDFLTGNKEIKNTAGGTGSTGGGTNTPSSTGTGEGH